MLRKICEKESEMITEYTHDCFSRLIHYVLIDKSTKDEKPKKNIKLSPRR